MENVVIHQSSISPVMNPVPLETEEFKLEMLDCGPAYSYKDAGSMCFSCLCGSGCLCGTP